MSKPKPATYRDLGPFSDWVGAAKSAYGLYPRLAPGAEAEKTIEQLLDFSVATEQPQLIQTGRRWCADGVSGQEISWSVGYGPRTQAWLLMPEPRPAGRLPGVVALHDHGGFKYYGKEKIADGPEGAAPFLAPFRRQCYGGRAFANALARAGFVVLVHDVFLWGSRHFPLSVMPAWMRRPARSKTHAAAANGVQRRIQSYNLAAATHEHLVEKYCTLLGTSFAAVVNYEDRVAVNFLRSRPEVEAGRIGCVGLSGGGYRAALLQARCKQIQAAVVVGMMSAYSGLLDQHVQCHTWMFFPPGLSRRGDWPDLAAHRAPSPLMVQYAWKDALFSRAGMLTAHRIIQEHYRRAGAAENYVGRFYPVPHRFDRRMQADAFTWLKTTLT